MKMEIRARKQRSSELAAEIDRKLRDIKELLAWIAPPKIKDLRLPLVAQLAKEAADLQKEYLAVLAEIAQAEKELF
jgi:hypothetical protein